MKTCFLYCTSLIFLFSVLVPRVSARTIFEDHFDGQDLSGWRVVQNFQWVNPALPCMNGVSPAAWQLYLQQLGIKILGPGCFTEIVPLTFQLPPNRSYSFEFDITLPESIDMDRNYTLRYVDSRNAYAMKVLGQRIFLEKLVDGQGWGVNGSSSSYPFQPNGTYHIKNEVNADHTMRVYVNDTLVLSFIDTTPFLTGGTIGFRASVGAILNSITWFDNARVDLTDSTPLLPVVRVSQRDPDWKDQLYDHTAQTIEKLGCALSSAVMMLKFHGIHEISAGIPMNPSSLNIWLIEQTDGYIASGLVNWIAITRLARQFHMQHPQSPSLEYVRRPATEAQLQQEFMFHRPPIIDLQGHFVVGTGLDFQELSILDPYDANKNTLFLADAKSLRTFIPSFTNLRYIQVIAPSSVRMKVTGFGQTWESVVETSIRAEGSDELPESISIIEIPKPEIGEYTLTMFSDDVTRNTVRVHRYDEHAEVVEDQMTVYTDKTGQSFIVPYSNTNEQPIVQQVNNTSLLHLTHALWELHEISTPDLYVALTLVVEKMSVSPLSEHQKLLNVLKYYLETYPEQITENGKQALFEALDQMWLLQGSDL